MRTTSRKRLTLFVTLTVLFALVLGGSLVAEARRARARKAKPAPTGSADCKKDADCVLVPDDCCSCNQGGKQRAIPKKEKATYEKDRKKRCAETECMEMMSQDPTCSQHAFCGAGICELGG